MEPNLGVDPALDNLMTGEDAIGNDGGDGPTQEQILEYLKQMQEQMAKNAQHAATGPGISIPPFVFFFAFIIFFSVVGWFSYKLIKSLSDKERKREEKRKLKELKKKK